MAKIKNNQQVLNKMLKSLNDFELAILRERLIGTTKFVIENEVQIRQNMQNSFINPQSYVDAIKKISDLVKFDE